MQITNFKHLKVGEVYFMYKIHLSPFLTNIKIIPPTEYKYLGQINNPKKSWKKNYLQFARKTKKGYSSRPKEIYLLPNSELYFGTNFKCYSSYAEACEMYDKDLDMIKHKLFKTQEIMKKIYDSIDIKKIKLRESKLKRIKNKKEFV